MRKPFLLLLLTVSLSWIISCQKSVKHDAQKEAKPAGIVKTSKSSMRIAQTSPNKIVYTSTEITAPIDLLSIEFNPATKEVNSTITVSDIAPALTYTLSFTDHIWKLYQTTQIEQKAADLSTYNLPLSTIQTAIADLEALMSNVISSASAEVLYSLSINISIFKTLARKAANPSNCNCTVHPSFLVGKSYFLCQEDHFYNKTNLVAALNQYETELGQSPDATIIKQYALAFQGSDIPFANIYGLMVSPQAFDQTLFNISNFPRNCAVWCPLGCGSDHGCCGNYEGCCIYRAVICYVHDIICRGCEPSWFCGPQCKPGYIITNPAVPTETDYSVYNDHPLTSEFVDYWNYLNVIKSWVLDHSDPITIPQQYNEAHMIEAINGFIAAMPSGYQLPEKASSPRFVYRIKNFVRGYYFQYTSAASPSPAFPPNLPVFTGGLE